MEGRNYTINNIADTYHTQRKLLFRTFFFFHLPRGPPIFLRGAEEQLLVASACQGGGYSSKFFLNLIARTLQHLPSRKPTMVWPQGRATNELHRALVPAVSVERFFVAVAAPNFPWPGDIYVWPSYHAVLKEDIRQCCCLHLRTYTYILRSIWYAIIRLGWVEVGL